jgi:hypothetical protein
MNNLMKKLVCCPSCDGDGKETCHNPDHGFISAMGWNEIGRLGCPACGHHPEHKIHNGGNCELCSGAGEVQEDLAISFCKEMDCEFKLKAEP